MVSQHSITGDFEPPTASRPLLAAAVALIGLWFVPETWILGPIFSWELLGGAGPLETAAAVAGPICGALLLVLAFATGLPSSVRRSAGAILGAAALALPLVGRAPAVQFPVALVLPAAVAMALLAALARSRGRLAAAHLLLLAIPLATLAPFVIGAVFDDIPMTYLAGGKAPVRIWAAGLAISASIVSDGYRLHGSR
jgi:hypothetical protein